MVVPRLTVTAADVDSAANRYSEADIETIHAGGNETREDRIEHHTLCKKERIKEPFELPDMNKKNIIFQVDNHFEKEARMKKALLDLGLRKCFMIHAINVEYVPADRVNNIAEVEETYHPARDFFNMQEVFTQDTNRRSLSDP